MSTQKPHCRPGTTDAMQRLADENEALRAENKRLKGVTPDMPPRPPEGGGLPRYGLRWNGPTEPLTVPMIDGYWTPWHLAGQLRDELETAENLAIKQGEWLQAIVNITKGEPGELDRHSTHDVVESVQKALAQAKAAGAREALERAMKPKGFSDTVVRVDLMREIIDKMESGE